MGWATGKECPYCHIPLTGKVGFGGKAKAVQKPTAPVQIPGSPAASVSNSEADRLEQLERLMRLRDGNALTEEEFQTEKAKLQAAAEVVDLVLLGMKQKVPVIKVIREITGTGLREAKDLVDSAPGPIITGLERGRAETIKTMLEAESATVELR
ncbi:MAG: ribosomal protein L7/L12 [Solirubrobacterales bacterium]